MVLFEEKRSKNFTLFICSFSQLVSTQAFKKSVGNMNVYKLVGKVSTCHKKAYAILFVSLNSMVTIFCINNPTVVFKSDPKISSVSITWELVGSADSWPHPDSLNQKLPEGRAQPPVF